ncbi:thioesterase domain-containing protein [Kribbella sp. NPDC051718]|uniref:thioesterase domain-containing protein n=1 Tax=Kribbella sp. NPDC051718 TaxID=3155168 RepID=UPI00343B3558
MPRYRDHFEFCLALVWEQVLDCRNIPISKDFFTLGGDSEAAKSMLAEVARRLDAAVPTADFVSAPTIESLARRVRETRHAQRARQEPFVIPGSGEGPSPLVFLHTVEGEITYSERILCADLGRPVIGIRSVGMDLEEAPLATVEAMASRYISDLIGAGVEGPYVLAGVSTSAVIALEMARQLTEQGRQVGFVGLLEPPPMGTAPFSVPELVDIHLKELCEVNAIEFRPDSLPDCVAALMRSEEFPPGHTFELVMRMVEIFALNITASDIYAPSGRYDGPTVLYESRAFGDNPEPLGVLSVRESELSEYERFWAQYISPKTPIRRQTCEHRGLNKTPATRTFLRNDIEAALLECR